MSVEKVDTLVIGAGQAGVAMSEHLSKRGVPHLVLEKNRIAESWRTARWDSLVANGPVWHDRFPGMSFDDYQPDEFAPKEKVADYFVAYAEQIKAPIRCGVEVKSVVKDGDVFRVETSEGAIEARNVVAATGAFQRPIIPTVVPAETGIVQIHSHAYRNPAQLPEGAVLVVGAGSSGTQIADELLRSGKSVYLSIGPHDRPPRRYRGKDFVWWLGALGIWDLKVPAPNTEHVTIAVSGAYGGNTVDFRRLAARGMTLLGRAETFEDGKLHFAPDLAKNIALGDANYLSLLDQADAYAKQQGLDLPEEPDARRMEPDPACVTEPILTLDLKAAGITAIIWATGYAQDFGWAKLDAFDEKGRPVHERGVSRVPGLYFVGLPWLSRRASSFIWGCWHDADYLAGYIAEGQSSRSSKSA
ncbi:NAD(P)/FAD-dependent oxidoreductase [Shinella sp. CPCC 100929]|uniref:NAD(P)/FAD-dependent oxidoreductase n=1 Tax=Shinella lacus TaxID=2654216 RepID=A0ABT1RBQ2_9HYPH|nr:NAD(P)/FAD-dependent oxidoreductase [Shinella lacus]MCQ4632616.1 NAD(P)/FAD-dependent oxidoreductase [Shinella lacus]